MGIIDRIKEIDRPRMKAMLHHAAKVNHRSYWGVCLDFFFDSLTRGSGYVDYVKGNYAALSRKERREHYFNQKTYAATVRALNTRGYTMIFHDKIVFNRIFREQIGRDFIDLREVGFEGFCEFVKGKETVFAKRHADFGGHGIEKMKLGGDLRPLYDRAMANGQYLIEDTLVQHEALGAINPAAVNNLRLVTLLKDGEVHVLFKTLRINGGTEEVISCDDIYMSLDEQGNILGNVVDDNMTVFDRHPATGFAFKDAKIPHVDKAIALVKSAARLIPEMRYVGWDVAITTDGAAIIEGNNFPSIGLHQNYLLGDGAPVGKKKIICDLLHG